jgi:microcystin degradation protein MlrC
MRVAVGEFKHEANTFSSRSTDLADFQADHLLEGKEMLAVLANTNSEVWGCVERATELGCRIEPLVAASAISGGPIAVEAYLRIKDALLGNLKAAGRVDGVYLALHGAMVAAVPGGEDATGALLQKVRYLVGNDVPIVVTLDLHANVTRQMATLANALIGYHTWPHVDQSERGQEAANLLVATIRREVKPVTALSKLRMLLQVENGQTQSGPMAELLGRARTWEAAGSCLCGSVFLVQPWLDLPEMGCAISVVTDDDPGRAQNLADELGRTMWDLRGDFDAALVPLDEAIERASRALGKPVVLADSSDSTGSGAPGDSTAILRRLVEREVGCRVLLPLVDQGAVQAAHKAGAGAMLRLALGGKLDGLFGQPVHLDVEVERVGEASFHFEGPAFRGLEVRMGPVAVLRVRDIHILVSERPVWTVDPAMYRAVDLEPTQAQIVVVKSPNMFRAAYEPIAHDIMVVDTPGLASGNFRSLPFARLPRPFYPFDEDWRGAPWA